MQNLQGTRFKETINSPSYSWILAILMILFSVQLDGCIPSSNQLSSEDLAQSLSGHIQPKRSAELAQKSSELMPQEDPELKAYLDQQRPKTGLIPKISSESFSPSDRMWGELALPAEAVERLHASFSQKHKSINMIIYGDSHTQGGFLGSAIANTLKHELDANHGQLSLSQGFVTVGHPVRSLISVKSHGVWLRQNWLYKRDVGPFGPLGIAFITQDKTAQMSVTLPKSDTIAESSTDLSSEKVTAIDANKFHQVTVFFHRTGSELPFCLQLTSQSEIRSNSESEVCHMAQAMQANEGSLGQLTIHAKAGDTVTLRLLKGYNINPSLVRKRNRSRKFIKKKRARIKRKYKGKKRSRLLEQIKAPNYAREPHILMPKKSSLRVFGFQVQQEQSIQVQSLGVRGATIWSPVEQSDPSLTTWLNDQNTDIISVWYGTNTAAREAGSLTVYESRFRTLLQRLKAASPKAACLVILPPDFGRREASCFLSKWQRRHLQRRSKNSKFLDSLAKTRQQRVCEPDELVNHRKRGRNRFPVPEVKNEKQWEAYKQSCAYRAPKYLNDLTEIQRKVGLEEQCAVYDTLSDMGGIGAMQKWACAEPDRLAQYDLVHLSPKGYEVIGQQIAKGLLSTLSMSPQAPQSLSDQFIEEKTDQSPISP